MKPDNVLLFSYSRCTVSVLDKSTTVLKGVATIPVLDPDGFWQRGTDFLCSRRDLWSVTRKFATDEDQQVPQDEIWMRRTVVTAAVKVAAVKVAAVKVSNSVPENQQLFQQHLISGVGTG